MSQEPQSQAKELPSVNDEEVTASTILIDDDGSGDSSSLENSSDDDRLSISSEPSEDIPETHSGDDGLKNKDDYSTQSQSNAPSKKHDISTNSTVPLLAHRSVKNKKQRASDIVHVSSHDDSSDDAETEKEKDEQFEAAEASMDGESRLGAACQATELGSNLTRPREMLNAPRYTVKHRNRTRTNNKVTPQVVRKPKTSLTEKEEERFFQWAMAMGRAGLRCTRHDFVMAVRIYLNKRNEPHLRFRDNNRPGKTWFHSYLKRHPQLSDIRAGRLIQPSATQKIDPASLRPPSPSDFSPPSSPVARRGADAENGKEWSPMDFSPLRVGQRFMSQIRAAGCESGVLSVVNHSW